MFFFDQSMFTKAKTKERVWSNAHEKIEVNQDFKYNIKATALQVVISSQYGVAQYMIKEFSFNKYDVAAFMEDLRKRFGSRRIAILLDNASINTCKYVAEKMKQLKIKPIYNLTYYPDSNCIEKWFSVLKNEFRKETLRQAIGEKTDKMNTEKVVEKIVLKNMEGTSAQRIAKYGEKLIESFP